MTSALKAEAPAFKDASLTRLDGATGDIGAATSLSEILLLAALAVPLAVAIAALAWRSTLMAPINYNEGCNAFFVAAVLSHTPLYLPPDALVTNNYPPLSFYLEAPVAALLGDAIFAGRLVAWLAFTAIGGLIVAASCKLHGDKIAAALAGMLFAGFMVVNYDIYVGMNDPQLLAHAIMLAGLWMLLRSPGSASTAIGAAALMGIALFVKHNILALPLSVTVWLALHNRRSAIAFVATGAAICGIGLAICLAMFGHDFIAGMLAPRQYIPTRAWRHAVEWLLPIEAPVFLGFLAAAIDRNNRVTRLFALYLAVALASAWLFAGGSGVNFNLMFDVVIGFSLAAGQLVAALRRQPDFRRWAIGAYAITAVVNAGLVGTTDQFFVSPWVAAERARAVAAVETVRMLAERPGPAICATPALCYWAHKPLELDPFNFGEGVAAGRKDEGIVLRRIASGYYAALEFPSPAAAGFLGPRLAAAAAEHYRVLSQRPGGAIVYVARAPDPQLYPIGSERAFREMSLGEYGCFPYERNRDLGLCRKLVHGVGCSQLVWVALFRSSVPCHLLSHRSAFPSVAGAD